MKSWSIARIARRSTRASSWWILWALLGLALFVQQASAHALLVRSVPEANAELSQPPPAIEMWFSEALEPSFSTARVLNTRGEEIKTGAVIFDPADEAHMTLPLGQLEPGIYTVAWQTLSKIDGHEWYGSFPFTLLNPDGSRPTGQATQVATGGRGDLPSAGEILARWLSLVGAMLLFGLPLLQIVLLPSRPDSASSQMSILTRIAHNAGYWLLLAGLAGLTLGGLLQIILQAIRLGNLALLPQLIFETRTGLLVLVRQVLGFAALLIAATTLPAPPTLASRSRGLAVGGLFGGAVFAGLLLISALGSGSPFIALSTVGVIVAGLAIAWRPRGETAPPPPQGKGSWPALILPGIMLLLSFSINSHAGAVPGSVWAILGDFLHLLAAAVWAAGLVWLPWLLWEWRRTQMAGKSTPILALFTRFSYLASFAVFVLALTGIFNSLVEIPTVEQLWTTPYGQVLLFKVLLVATAMAVALANNRLIHTRQNLLQHPRGLAHLNRTLTLELGVAVVLMLAVAILVQTPVPRALTEPETAFQPQLPFNAIVPAEDLYVHVQVSPNQIGQNRFWVHLYHADGSPIGEVQLVRLFFEYLDAQLGRATTDLTPLGDDTFEVEGSWLNQAGNWQLSVYVRRRGMDDILSDVTVEVPPPAGQTTAASPWVSPIPGVPLQLLWGLALLSVGLIPLLWRKPFTRLTPQRWSVFVGGTSILATFGLILVGLSIPTLRMAGADQPVPASPNSIARGAELYQQHCAACHGTNGLGDGPAAISLNPPPANFRIHVPLHEDAEIFGFISKGLTNTAMPAFQEQLPAEDIWHLVNYLRATFGNPASEQVVTSPTITPDSGAIAGQEPAPVVDTLPFEGVGGLVAGDTPLGQLWQIPVQPGAQRQPLLDLPTGAFGFQPAWSPDGQQIAFGYIPPPDPQDGSRTSAATIWIANADGSDMQPVTFPDKEGTLSYRDPAWSPDGRFIWTTMQVAVFDDAGNWVGMEPQIRQIELATGGATTIVPQAFSPAPAPDGEKLAYLVTDPETLETSLWVASVTGENPQKIIDGSTFYYIFAPRFAPNGKRLAFAAVGEPSLAAPPAIHSWTAAVLDSLGRWFLPLPAHAHGLPPADVWMINVDGTGLTRLTTIYEENPTPAWSKDGRFILFGGARGLYLLEVATQKLVRFSDQPVDGQVDWKMP